jgi:hypothetical protein
MKSKPEPSAGVLERLREVMTVRSHTTRRFDIDVLTP